MIICKICNNEYKDNQSLGTHISKKHKIKTEEYYNLYIPTHQHIHTGKCRECGEKTSFINLTKGYLKFCSSTCAGKNSDSQLKLRNTNVNKYGTPIAIQSDSVKSTYKKNYNNKTGYNTPMENPIVASKMSYILKSKSFDEKKNILLKRKLTNLQKYGNENYNNIEKSEYTCLNRYGVKNVFSSDIIRQKRKKVEYIKIYNKMLENENFNSKIEPLFNLQELGSTKKLYKFKCKICFSVFEDNLYNNHVPRCLNCFPLKISNGESELNLFLLKFLQNEKIYRNDTTILNGLELDFYIPFKNIAIEYNGNYWHSELNGKDKNYHLNKTILCENKGIQLIHIFEDEWEFKQDIVKNRLLHILGISNKKIHARKCEVREISPKESMEFLECNHIQGRDNSSIQIGAFYNNELIALMTFGKERIALGKRYTDGTYELMRFSTKYSCSGIASKILKRFIHSYNPKKIISYADRRWTTNIHKTLYDHIGFTKISNGSPNYWYLENDRLNRHHRFSFRKNILKDKLNIFDNNLTEWENMKLNGYDRIWDCGSFKYELITKKN